MLSLLLIPINAFSDRYIGWGGDKQHRKTIGFLVGVLGALGVAWALHRWDVALLGIVGVGTRRWLPFKPPFGTITVRNVPDGVLTLARWLIPALAAAAWIVDTHGPAYRVLPFLAYAAAATLLAVILGVITKPGTPPLSYDANAFVEAIRGASFGAALAVWAVI